MLMRTRLGLLTLGLSLGATLTAEAQTTSSPTGPFRGLFARNTIPGRSTTGEYGFGLNYHPGYGYGGAFKGVGPHGGYPFYGGPGYPHPLPCKDRGCWIKPVLYNAGPGYPTPEHPNVFGPIGPLPPNPNVVTFENDPAGAGFANYGCYTGAIPYPEEMFTPSPSESIENKTSVDTPPPASVFPPPPTPPPSVSSAPTPMTTPGIDVRPAGPNGTGLRVDRVHPGSPAERAGLRAGDVIRAANGYGTDQPGHLSWVVGHAGPDQMLRLTVHSGAEGPARVVPTSLR